MADADAPEGAEGEPDPVIISKYTRAQALEDGLLIDVTQRAREAGIRVPTAVTRGVWNEFVELTPAAVAAGNNIEGRLWDIVWMFRCAALRLPGERLIYFELFVVTDRIAPSRVGLKAIISPGDDGEPVITILLPEED